MRDPLSLIGRTPVVQVRGFDTGPCSLFLKLEDRNPGGSIKDRIALAMIEAAERSGQLKPGGTIVEATAGNTGIALAMVAQRKGYRIVLTIPDKMSPEKVAHVRGLGAEVIITPASAAKGNPENFQDRAAAIARETGAFHVDQFSNPANPLAHEETTGPEILGQMANNVDAVICAVGSGGTITGLSRFFARVSPRTEVILADPEGSCLAGIVRGVPSVAGSYLVEGIGSSAVPPGADLGLIRKAYTVSDRESFHMVRELLRIEGILAGTSTGTLLGAALRFCREQTQPLRVLTFVCDSGSKYLSRAWSDAWLAEKGLSGQP